MPDIGSGAIDINAHKLCCIGFMSRAKWTMHRCACTHFISANINIICCAIAATALDAGSIRFQSTTIEDNVFVAFRRWIAASVSVSDSIIFASKPMTMYPVCSILDVVASWTAHGTALPHLGTASVIACVCAIAVRTKEQ
jgi:hypothetical protein